MLSLGFGSYLQALKIISPQQATLLSLVAGQCQTSNYPQEPGQYTNQTLCIGQEQRSYLLFLPENYEAIPNARSLILSYHGGSRDATTQLNLDQLTSPYFNKDSIVVYPQGISVNGENTWQGVPEVPTNDLLFTNSLLDHLSASYRVDPSRIYATGKSQGGGFVGVLACDAALSKRIAAFAPVSGAFYTSVPASQCSPDTVEITCHNDRPLPFVEFHGGKDATINYQGDIRRQVCLPGIPHYITEWARRNNLETKNMTSAFTKDTAVYSFGNGLVKGYFDTKIGHDWPSTLKNSDNERNKLGVASFNASSIIMDFFKQYRLPI